MKLLKSNVLKLILPFRKKGMISMLTVIAVALTVVITDINTQAYKDEKIIEIDVLAYYAYLPATFIFNDLTLNIYYEQGPQKDHISSKVWFNTGPDNQHIIPVTYGLSVLYSPFFLIAHLYSSYFDINPYGYAWPYQLAIQFAALFYLILGLLILRRILLGYFSEYATSLVLLAIVLGTNLFYYSSFEAGMSHVYNFFLINLFLFLLIKWLKKPGFLISVFLGLITGFIILVRPSNILIISLFVFWGISSWKDIYSRFIFLFRNFHKVLIMIFFSILVWVPQFLYWKFISGQYLYFSYGDNAYFFWNEPQIINILFSYRKGWLIYTPIMALAIIGIAFLAKYQKKTILPVSVVLLSYIYVLSCWCFWWFGGSYGGRGFIDIYGIMAIPLAAITSYFITNKKWVFRVSFLLIFSLLIYHSLFQTAQYRFGAIHWGYMTNEAYWDSFGRKRPSAKFYDLLEEPPYKEVMQRIKEAKEKEKTD